MSYVIYQGYFTSEDTVEILFRYLPEMASDELESIVGRFPKDHMMFANRLRGEYIIKQVEGGTEHIIRHHFTKKVLFSEFVKEKYNE